MTCAGISTHGHFCFLSALIFCHGVGENSHLSPTYPRPLIALGVLGTLTRTATKSNAAIQISRNSVLYTTLPYKRVKKKVKICRRDSPQNNKYIVAVKGRCLQRAEPCKKERATLGQHHRRERPAREALREEKAKRLPDGGPRPGFRYKCTNAKCVDIGTRHGMHARPALSLFCTRARRCAATATY